jgi:hypothetical protein
MFDFHHAGLCDIESYTLQELWVQERCIATIVRVKWIAVDIEYVREWFGGVSRLSTNIFHVVGYTRKISDVIEVVLSRQRASICRYITCCILSEI